MKLNKKTIVGLSVPFFLLMLSGCESKEKKALDSAIQSRELSQMRQFITQYPDANQELVDSARIILAKWEQDSADYNSLKDMDDIVKRAQAEGLYMENHPDGLYKDIVTEMFKTDGPEAKAILERLLVIGEGFTNYAFYNSGNRYPICLTSPDENGKGIGFLYTLFGYLCFYYAINLDDLNDDAIQCVYYIENNKEIHFTLSYSSNDHCLYYNIKGKISTWYGQLDKDYYDPFLKSVKEIRRKGKIIRQDVSWLKNL